MRIPMTLSRYIARHLLLSCALVLLVIVLVMGLGELIEMIRRASHKDNMPMSVVLEMVALKLPFTVEKILPFAMLIGSMLAFTRLSKSSELIIARASGISVWQFLAPAMLVAIAIGIFFTTAFNPISSAMIARYEKLEGKYIQGKASTLSVSPSGLWLRHVEQLDEAFFGSNIEEYILHARRIDQSDMTMHRIIIFMYASGDRFIGRIDAQAALLEAGHWRMNHAIASAPGKLPVMHPTITLQTDLSPHQIKESFASPKTLSFWELPSFIDTLQKAGFSAIRHQLHWMILLSTPLMLLAMLLLGALFSLRHHRRGRISIMVTLGVFSGFIIYFASNLVYALGYSGSLPVSFAAFLPPLITIMIATSALLHLEDG